MVKKQILANGLRLVTVPMLRVKSVTALVMVGTGSRFETLKTNGLSHFLEHMAFKGTKSRPSSLAISSLLDGIGANFNAFTAKDHTGFYIKAESRHQELIVDVLADMLQNSLFAEAEIEKEKGVIIEEINMYEDQPQALIGEYFEALLFPKSPLGWRVLGSKENIQALARKDFVDYAAEKYHGQSLVVGLAGDLSKDPVDLVAKHFGRIPAGKENDFLPFQTDQSQPKVKVAFKKTDQAHLILGFRGYPLTHPDRYAAALLAIMLGGNMSSRLFLEVREKRGLAYYVHAQREAFIDTGYLSAAAGLNIGAVEEAIKVILGEFEKIRVRPPSLAELRRAKDFWRGKMVLALEDSARTISFYLDQELLEKKIETPEMVMDQVEKVTSEDILRVARDLFVNKGLNLAVIGPFSDEEKFKKLLKI